MSRRTVVLLVVLSFAIAGCGGGSGTKAAAPITTVAGNTATTIQSGPKAAARWETVTILNGSGNFESPEFSILANAIQWRVRYTCATGMLRITSTPPPRRPAPVVETACPKEETGYSIVTGPVRISIETPGAWKAIVDQQVDSALEEPLLAGMTPDKVVATGTFYRVEKEGQGTAKLYRLADGRRFVRFEGFEVAQNTELFVWLSEAVKPATSVDVVNAARVQIANLKSTLGSQNYEVPASVPTDKIRSIAIWCEPVSIVYAVAALSP